MPTAIPLPAPGATPIPGPTQSPARSLGLDLIRAVAILAVMVSHWANNVAIWFHLAPPRGLLGAGEIGVDLFFALSGFLIGRILLSIAATAPGWRGFATFMARRAMRTLPLYFLWLALLLLCFPPHPAPWATALRFATLTQNLLAPMPPHYYFAVSWSLTIEEWFYLLFGGALMLAAGGLSRLPGGRAAAAVWPCLALFLAFPLALRWHALSWSLHSLAIRDEVFFRIDEIAYGVLMARLWIGNAALFRHPWPLLAAGLALIAGALSGRLPLPFNHYLALLPNAAIIGCALSLPAALRLRHAPRWFALPVRWLSTRSYALYLVHLTILVDVVQNTLLWPHRISAPVAAGLAIAAPCLLAECSYRWLEAPILRRRPAQFRAAPAVLHSSQAFSF